MCLIILGVQSHPEYELVLVANRDEFFERKTLKAHLWKKPEIFAGKDMVAGGTWLGVDKRGRLAAVTNFRNPETVKTTAPSRGLLPVLFLENNMPADVFLQSLSKNGQDYNGFNLIVKDENGIFHYSNVTDKITAINQGIHGLSNAFLNTNWPKVLRGKEKLAKALEENRLNEKSLNGILYDSALAQDKDLPRTGVPLALERQLSAMFIKTPGYGTRCTTVVKIGTGGSVNFTEVIYNEAGKPTETTVFDVVR